jgi:hypothetical protein
MKKQLVAAGVAATIGITGLGVGVANAETASTAKADPMSSLVDKISSKFNLNKTEVQQVFDEQKTAMQAEHEQKVKDEVAKLVTDGKITQAQADAINAKRAELQKEREANKDTFKDKTETERKAEMDKRKTELETWAKEQGISTDYLRYVMGHGPGGPRGHGGPRPDSGAESTNQ